MLKKVGIIGASGRLGNEIGNLIASSNKYQLGLSYNRSNSENISIDDVFLDNDYIIDASSSSILSNVLRSALNNPKPLLILTTGWQESEFQQILNSLSNLACVIIASNTSYGAYMQGALAYDIAKNLGQEYDIDIVEQHHRNKLDQPSGTALNLFNIIAKSKQENQNLNYTLYDHKHNSQPRSPLTISIESRRSGNIPGEHEIYFTSSDEIISVKHVALNRSLFAHGAIKILDWLLLNEPKSGIYYSSDIFKIEVT